MFTNDPKELEREGVVLFPGGSLRRKRGRTVRHSSRKRESVGDPGAWGFDSSRFRQTPSEGEDGQLAAHHPAKVPSGPNPDLGFDSRPLRHTP